MKSLKEIIHLPIISVLDGKIVGKIKSVVIEPQNGKVEYFLVDDQSMFQVKVVPMSNILGIGDEALMIESSSLVVDAQNDSKVIELLNKNVGVVESKVFTKKGKNLGTIKEIFLEVESGKIIGCEVEKDGNSKFMSSNSIITYGKEITIVEHDIHEKLLESLEELLGKNAVSDDCATISSTVESIHKNQREYLLGREIKQTMKNGDDVLAYEGQIVTEELIDKLEQAGKFLELTLNIK